MMRAPVNGLLDFLKHNKRLWVPPIVVFALLLAYLAWKSAHAPDVPFDYRGD